MLLSFGLSLLILFLLLGTVNYIQVKNTVIPLTKELSQEILTARSSEMGRLMQSYINEVKALSRIDIMRHGQPEEIRQYLINRGKTLGGDYEMFFYADLKGDYITTHGDGGNVSDRDYFKAVIKDGAFEYISDPIVSRSTGAQIFVIACPIINENGEKTGLAAATVLLETLSKIAGDIRIGQHGFGYVVDKSGMLIGHPDSRLIMNLNFLTSDEQGFKSLDSVGKQMIKGESGTLAYKRPNGSNMITVFNPVPNTLGWSLGISMLEEELMGKAYSLMRSVIVIMVIILIIVILIIIFISGRISKPVAELKKGVKKVSEGDLNYNLNIKTGDEIEELSKSFNKMTVDLKEYMNNLKEETAKRQAVESELTIAKEIQQSILPRVFPPFPGRNEFELYSIMHPAKEVGGDFYDFFFYDKDTFVMLVGDVSGKGVPAALFMMLSRTLLHSIASETKDPALVLKRVNNILAQDNDTSMFVTVFLAYYSVSTGEIVYSNGGHLPALKITKDNKFEEHAGQGGMAIGVLPDIAYNNGSLSLGKNEKFVLYTDGVSEACKTATGEFYGTQKFIDYFLNDNTFSAKKDCANVLKNIMEFQGEDQHDDITLSVFKRVT